MHCPIYQLPGNLLLKTVHALAAVAGTTPLPSSLSLSTRLAVASKALVHPSVAPPSLGSAFLLPDSPTSGRPVRSLSGSRFGSVPPVSPSSLPPATTLCLLCPVSSLMTDCLILVSATVRGSSHQCCCVPGGATDLTCVCHRCGLASGQVCPSSPSHSELSSFVPPQLHLLMLPDASCLFREPPPPRFCSFCVLGGTSSAEILPRLSSDLVR